MKQLRQEDLSLNHYIRNEVLKDFIETEKNVPLVYLDDLSQESGSAIYQAESYMTPSPISNGRGWVYTDNYAAHTEQTDSVIVYDSLGTVISGGYDVDYIDGRVIFPNTSYNPAAVTYRWYYVAIVEEWDLVQASEVPVVSVDISGFTKDGFQLGGGKIVPRKTNLHLFATDQAERDDLSEVLYDGLYLKSSAFQEFNNGTMIDWDGRWNDAYTFSTVSGSSPLKFDDVKARNIYSRLVRIPSVDATPLSDLNRFRGKVSCDMFHWEEA